MRRIVRMFPWPNFRTASEDMLLYQRVTWRERV